VFWQTTRLGTDHSARPGACAPALRLSVDGSSQGRDQDQYQGSQDARQDSRVSKLNNVTEVELLITGDYTLILGISGYLMTPVLVRLYVCSDSGAGEWQAR
jgi:hypothetical protein